MPKQVHSGSNNLQQAAMVRIFILLLVVCVTSFIWEASRNSNLQPASGTVTGKAYKDYTIRFSVQGKSYQFVTRLGVFDLFGGLNALAVSDQVPVLVNPENPRKAVINTLNGRYGITLSFIMLLLIFVVTMAVLALKKRGRKPL